MSYASDRDIAEMLKAKLGPKRTQKVVAEELGISEAYLSDFLNGRRNAGPMILKGLGYDPTPHYRKHGKELNA